MAGFGVQNTNGNIALYRFPGAPDRPTGDIEAHLVTLACSDPPEGAARWTDEPRTARRTVRLRGTWGQPSVLPGRTL